MRLHWRVWGCKWGSCAITSVWRNPGGGAKQTAVCLCTPALPESVEKRLRCNETGRSEDNPAGPASSSAGNLSCSNTSTSLSHRCKLLGSHSTISAYWWDVKRFSCIFLATSSFRGNFIHQSIFNTKADWGKMATSSQGHMETNNFTFTPHVIGPWQEAGEPFREPTVYTEGEHTDSTQKSSMTGIKPTTLYTVRQQH